MPPRTTQASSNRTEKRVDTGAQHREAKTNQILRNRFTAALRAGLAIAAFSQAANLLLQTLDSPVLAPFQLLLSL